MKKKLKMFSVRIESTEIYAAIAAALHLHIQDYQIHDTENTILTIRRASQNYSPWSSKIHTLRQLPRK